MTGPWAPLVLTLVVAMVWVTLLCAGRAHRLRLLHRRTRAARAGLEAALERRAAAALGVAAAQGAGERAAQEGADRMRAAATATRAGGTGSAADDREGAENALGRLLATADRSRLPPGLRAELVDAEQLVAVARSVHNDAVRDTLGLRSRRLVRWLRLAGTAPPPAYFEIADTGPGSRSEVGSTPPR